MQRLIVVKDGVVIATHTMDQAEEIADLYDGAEIVEYNGPVLLPFKDDGTQQIDPRLDPELAGYVVTE